LSELSSPSGRKSNFYVMTKKMIIVESPAKARTLKNILGDNYIVESSVGHIRDLPKSRFGIRIDDNFEPEYVTISGKLKVVNRLIKAGKTVDEIYLAADPDREGEAICHHLNYYLKKETNATIQRILYYEITRQAIQDSLKKPGLIDENKVNAQQTRRILDRIVGYQLSPFLWKKVRRGLSAGRVQSVALRLIVDREREIDAFTPEEYWTITLQLEGSNPPVFKAFWYGMNGKKQRISDKTMSDTIVENVSTHPLMVSDVDKKKVSRRPSPPFITSTLQQEAARRYRFAAQKTMRIAQSLYEGKDMGKSDVHGLITYMRTDSPRISRDAQAKARSFIESKYGMDYVPGKPPVYRARKGSQEAHEAIRPTDVNLTPEKAVSFLASDELKLYKLIWERFVVSQMADAVVNVTTVKISAGEKGRYEFRSMGSEIVFEGFYCITGLPKDIKPSSRKEKESSDDSELEDRMKSQPLPVLTKGAQLTCHAIEPVQNFTKPPSRYTEASLVKELESKGIGRPSTYAAIMATIRSHDYAVIRERRFYPTELGIVVSDILVKGFPDILSVKFTADMENRLDEIEKGKTDWKNTLSTFYVPFKNRLDDVEKTIKALNRTSEPAKGVKCPECDGDMQIRWGKKGRFLSCNRYPDCKGILPYENLKTPGGRKAPSVNVPVPCPECGASLALKKGRYGLFVSCSTYPKCKGKGPRPEGLPCAIEKCPGKLVLKKRKGRKAFYGCSEYPECTFVFDGTPVVVSCKNCGNPYHKAAEKNRVLMMQCPRCKNTVPLENTPNSKEISSNDDTTTGSVS
jgi:DNA topoisomerase I